MTNINSLFKILKFDILNIFHHLESMLYHIVEIVNIDGRSTSIITKKSI